MKKRFEKVKKGPPSSLMPTACSCSLPFHHPRVCSPVHAQKTLLHTTISSTPSVDKQVASTRAIEYIGVKGVEEKVPREFKKGGF